MKKFFSIIVPIYKVEKYLKETIESVLKQAYKDYEMILVDDGSPDQCPEICDYYCQKSDCIKVIHKENGGLSDARNCGMDNANGEYIIFLDGDDLLEEDALSKLYYNLQKKEFPDILIYNYTCFSKDKKFELINIPSVDGKEDYSLYDFMRESVTETKAIPWKAWQSTIRNDFIKKNEMQFDADIIGAEDCDWFMKIATLESSFAVINESLICYRVGREGSIITTPSYNAIKGQLEVLSGCYWELKEKFSDKDVLTRYFAMRYTNIIILIAQLNSREEIESCLSIIRKNKKIIEKTPLKLKYIIPKIVWWTLGFYNGSLFLKKIKRKSK